MISDVLLLSGSLFILIAALGLVRMPDLFLRMHAAAKAGTLGIGLMLTATTIVFFDGFILFKLILTILFILLSVPIGIHLIAKASYHSKLPLEPNTSYDLSELVKRNDPDSAN